MIRKVHQVIFSHTAIDQVSGYVKKATKNVENIFACCDYQCWDLGAAGEFISANFDSPVKQAFDQLKPLAYKADLFKYCLLYKSGGWYIDAGVKIYPKIKKLFFREPDPNFILFRGTGCWDAPWSCSLAVVYARPENPVFNSAMEEVIANCNAKHYGENPLCPTMSAFGRALAKHKANQNIIMGEVVDVKRFRVRRAYHVPNIGLIGARKPVAANAGNVSVIGIPGSNNYVDMWKNREIYND